MKFSLTENDHLERHHIYGLIQRYIRDHHGEQPEYIIVHPATFHKIIMVTNERQDDFTYPVVNFQYRVKNPPVTIYGIAFIKSMEVEEDFIIVT